MKTKRIELRKDEQINLAKLAWRRIDEIYGTAPLGITVVSKELDTLRAFLLRLNSVEEVKEADGWTWLNPIWDLGR